ncbi:FISUMP domain-containing protein [Marivirga tractuosa]|uniref:FISUMP domain-containing protein n=1 Tax=Marivirga tractuosa TaxID=1006 RepID=UPI0035CEF4C7
MRYSFLVVVILFITFLFSCDDDNDIEITSMSVEISDIRQTSALGTARIVSNGGSDILNWGICLSESPNPTTNDITYDLVGSTQTRQSLTLEGLNANTTYFAKAFATNSAGTGYSEELTFKTIPKLITDIDGNTYNIIMIGSQAWMQENLKVTRFRNGDDIIDESTGSAQYIYDDSETNLDIYGRLYNLESIKDERNIAPEGWHIPSDEEWDKLLIDVLGGYEVAGGKLKESGTEHWLSPNNEATNESNFTALGGGYRQGSDDLYIGLLVNGYWYSHSGKVIILENANGFVASRNKEGTAGTSSSYSIRCIMD